MKEDSFQVKVEFSGYAAKHVRERIWSHDQVVDEKGDGNLELTFTATSDIEALSWILSYGHEAQVLEPDFTTEQAKRYTSSTCFSRLMSIIFPIVLAAYLYLGR